MGFRQGKGFLSSKKHRFGRERTRKISLCKKLSYSEKTIWRMDLGRSSQTKILGLRTCFYDPGLANTSKDPFGIRSFPDCRKVVHLLIQGAVEKRAQNSYSTKLQDSTAGELPGLPAILLSRAKRWKYPCEDKFSISSALGVLPFPSIEGVLNIPNCRTGNCYTQRGPKNFELQLGLLTDFAGVQLSASRKSADLRFVNPTWEFTGVWAEETFGCPEK